MPPRGSAEEAELRARLADAANPVPAVLAFVIIALGALVWYIYKLNAEAAKAPKRPKKKVGKKKQMKINAKEADQYQESE